MIIIQNDNNYEINTKLLEKASKILMRILGQNDKKLYAIVNFVDEQQIQEINKEYRNKDKITDVISFRMLDNQLNQKVNKKNYPYDYDPDLKKVYIGEIYICYKRALMQSEEYEHSVEREIAFLTTHGLLHLMGFDHEKEFERAIMNDLEEKTMTKMKLTR